MRTAVCLTVVAALAASARPADADPDGGLYALTLTNAVEGDKPLHLYLTRRAGTFTGAWAAVRPHRFLPGEVDTSGLKLLGALLTGEVKTTVASRAWGAAPDRPAALTLRLDCPLAGPAVAGRYAGSCAGTNVAGQVAGTRRPFPRGGPDERRGGFPNWRGPTCSGASADSGLELGLRLEEAPLLWESDERTANGYHGRGTTRSGFIQGCYASPVIAAGRVYLFYADPSGPTIDPKWLARLDDIFRNDPKGGPFFKRCAEALGLDPQTWARKYSSVEADDALVCLDADTGKTLWRATFVEKGLAVKHQGRGIRIQSKLADQLTMCVGDGKAFFAGTTGRAYCLDAATGQPIWESTIPDYWEHFEKEKARYRQAAAVPMPHREQLCAASIYADGVFVCSDGGGYDPRTGKHGGPGNGLVGFDAETGKLLWRVPKMLGRIVSPVRWTHRGTDYVIGVNDEATCLAPRTGEVLWRVPAPHNNAATPAVCEDWLVTSGNDGAGVTGFRLTPQSCTKAWEVKAKHALGYASPIIWRGHVYFRSKAHGFVCAELATGRVVGMTGEGCPAGGCGSPVAGDGRMFMESNAAGVVVVNMDPDAFGITGRGERNVNYSCSTTPAYAAGRLVVRCAVGIKCFDMRQASARPSLAPEPKARRKPGARPKPKPAAEPPRPPKPVKPPRGPLDPDPPEPPDIPDLDEP